VCPDAQQRDRRGDHVADGVEGCELSQLTGSVDDDGVDGLLRGLSQFESLLRDDAAGLAVDSPYRVRIEPSQEAMISAARACSLGS
jgi:hypothetical protein